MKKKLSILLTVAIVILTLAGCSQPAQNAKYVVLDENFGAEEYGVGMRKADGQFCEELQKQLDEMIKDGTAAKISQKWFAEDIMIKDAAPSQTIKADAADKSLEKIKTAKKLVLGLDDNFPPMGFRDEASKIVGFDIDLATEVAKRMGVELVTQPINWDAKEMELSTGKIDVIWNGLTITPERLDAMLFSKPYIANKQIIITLDSSKIANKADLKGKKVGLQKGSSALDALNKDTVTASSLKEVVEYKDNVTAFMDLKAGRIDAIVADEIAARYIIASEEKK